MKTILLLLLGLQVLLCGILTKAQEFEEWQIQTVCKDENSVEISQNYLLCIPSVTPESEECTKKENFVDKNWFESQPLSFFSEIWHGFIYVDMRRTSMRLYPPHLSAHLVLQILSLAYGSPIIRFSSREKDLGLLVDGEPHELTSDGSTDIIRYTATVEQGFNKNITVFKDLCTGRAIHRLYQWQGFFRSVPLTICRDVEDPVNTGLEFQFCSYAGCSERVSVSQCQLETPGNRCPGTHALLYYGETELSRRLIDSGFGVNFQIEDTTLCIGYLYSSPATFRLFFRSEPSAELVKICSLREDSDQKLCTEDVSKEQEDSHHKLYNAELQFVPWTDNNIHVEFTVSVGEGDCAGTTTINNFFRIQPPTIDLQTHLWGLGPDSSLLLADSAFFAHFKVYDLQDTYYDQDNTDFIVHSLEEKQWVKVEASAEICGVEAVESRIVTQYDVFVNWAVVEEELALRFRTLLPNFPGLQLFFEPAPLGTEYLASATEYQMTIGLFGRNETTSIKTSAPVVKPPYISYQNSECVLHVQFEGISGCRYSIDGGENWYTSNRIDISQDQKHVQAVQQCGTNNFEWEFDIPEEVPDFALEDTLIQLEPDLEKCSIWFSVENWIFNPHVKFRVGFMELYANVKADSRVELDMRHFHVTTNSLEVTASTCGEDEQQAIQVPIDIPVWKSEPTAEIQWNSQCDKYSLVVDWENSIEGEAEVYVRVALLSLEALGGKEQTSLVFSNLSPTTLGNRQIWVELGLSACGFGRRHMQLQTYECKPHDSDSSSKNPEPSNSSSSSSIFSTSSDSDDMPDTPPPPPPEPERRRPSTRSIRMMWGDPHLQTIDGLEYTYNGIGEYMLFRTQNNTDSPDLQLQVMLSPVQEGTFKGSVITAVALSLHTDVVVEYDLEDGLFINKESVDISQESGQHSIPDSVLEVEWRENDNGRRVVDFTVKEGRASADEVMLIRCIVGSIDINFAYSLPIFSFENSEGLIGFWDEDMSNDLVTSDGVQLSHNASESEIYEFGLSWNLNNIPDRPTPLFHKDHSDVDPTQYKPSFVEGIQDDDIDTEKRDACRENTESETEYRRCLLDVAATNDVTMATATQEMRKVEKEVATQLIKIPQDIEGIYASDIGIHSAFISWNNLRSIYRDAPYFVESITLFLTPRDEGEVMELTTGFDSNGIQVYLEPGTRYTLSAVLHNSVGMSPESEHRRFTTQSVPVSSSSSSVSSSSQSAQSISEEESSPLSSAPLESANKWITILMLCCLCVVMA